MNVKTIYLGGVPASGKSTLFKRIRDVLFADAEAFAHGLCRGVARGPYRMLGVFDGSTFEGTDRLSMAVIGDALDYVAALEREGARRVVFVEGDRLFNKRFIRETHAEAYVIDAAQPVLDARRSARAAGGDGQSATFLKAKRTKVENLVRELGLRRAWNNTAADQARLVAYFVGKARAWAGGAA